MVSNIMMISRTDQKGNLALVMEGLESSSNMGLSKLYLGEIGIRISWVMLPDIGALLAGNVSFSETRPAGVAMPCLSAAIASGTGIYSRCAPMNNLFFNSLTCISPASAHTDD